MKKNLFFTVLLFVVYTTAFAQPSCKSLFANAKPVFDKMAKSYIEFRQEAAKIIVPIVIPELANAQQEVNNLIDKATQMQLDLYSSYGVVAAQSNMTVGDVNLIVPLKKWDGDLYTERTFTILNSPYDKIVIKIKKIDGSRGVKFKACAKYSNGSPYDEKVGQIDKDGNGVERTITFTKNMVDKNISLHLVAFESNPLNKCDYVLSIEGFFDNEEMQKIYDDNNFGDKKNKGKKNKKEEEKVMEKKVDYAPIDAKVKMATDTLTIKENKNGHKGGRKNKGTIAKASYNSSFLQEKSWMIFRREEASIKLA
jgi:hypothetical protein